MLRRIFTILLLAQQSVWLLAVLPGHTRGAILLPGAEGGDGCCAPAEPAPPRHACCPPAGREGHGHHAPTPAERLKNCALCVHLTKMTPAPPPDVVPAPSGAVCAVLAERGEGVVSVFTPRVFDPTGPPDLG
ncbi:MAG TPA: hypothetical protein VF796_06095 [Humisphaera sp.]